MNRYPNKNNAGVALGCIRSLFVASWLTSLAIAPRAFADRLLIQSLDGAWELSSDDRKSWHAVVVPATFEQQIDRSFNGVAWLRRRIKPVTVPPWHRLLVEFDGVATEATVWLNGQRVGSHLGAWTPFRCDITDAARQAGDGVWELSVRVDEKVGHNTQGFLPAITDHFGGIWQSVRIVQVPEGAIDDWACLAWGDPETSQFELNVPFGWGAPEPTDVLGVSVRLRGQSNWSIERRFQLASIASDKEVTASRESHSPRASLYIPLPDNADGRPVAPRLWSPESPQLYEIQLRIFRGESVRDQCVLRAAFRTIEARGSQLLLNGKPLCVRGLLNWGYRQGKTAPETDPAAIRQELELVRKYGFNLMKLCLWMPPRALLDLADELGILVWMEYPAWHPQFSPQFLSDLNREYAEFFAYDRNHPSVILRSLTCETGQSADLAVIQSLYDLCHAAVPHSLVEDDSSWIEWNRVHDFYDDHPYGNNHSWQATLQRLNRYIAQHAEKPLLLGESIAADTWYGPVDPDAPWDDAVSPPHFAAGNRQWLRSIAPIVGTDALKHLRDDSLQYANLMRKYQIETYRRQVPSGGYVVSVIRDFPLAGMGFLDYYDQPKWEPAAWSWHGDTMLLLATPEDRRSFFANQPITGELSVSHFGSQPLGAGTLSLELQNSDGTVLERTQAATAAIDVGQVITLSKLEWRPPDRVVPISVRVKATLRVGDREFNNQWPLWIVPATVPSLPAVSVHDSWDFDPAALGVAPSVLANRFTPSKSGNGIVLCRKLDVALLDHLERGGTALVLPNDRPASFQLQQHWFLRGGPVINDRLVSDELPRQMLVELQHFDLAGPVIPELRHLDSINPLIALWDNHDIAQVKTHGLAFEMPVGRGRLMVSALRHTGNPVGEYMFAQLLKRLSGPSEAGDDTGASNARRLRDELSRRELALDRELWRFMPDADHSGNDRGWSAADFDDSNWSTIRIDRHWEAQGYEKLDGWAWYRRRVQIPGDWPAGRCYLNFTGVDDYYRVYVNGTYVGSGGDIETKQTAFEERKSHDISKLVESGRQTTISVEVYDWYGAGGIFRPVTLSVTPLSSDPPMLK